MIDYIIAEIRFFLLCMLDGFLLLMIYDVFRILRRIIKHKDAVVAIEDVLFGIFSGIQIFVLTYRYNNGVIRLFLFVGFLIGILVYNKVFSRSVVSVFVSVLKPIIKFINKINACIGVFLKKCTKIVKISKKIENNIEK